MDSCPLCSGTDTRLYHEDSNRRIQRPYYQCQQCQLVFVPRAYFLTAQAEKAEYDLHENHQNDTGYRQFLQRFSAPYLAALKRAFSPKPDQCLDLLEFGCGPGPLLAEMLMAAGHNVALYDAFYYPDKTLLTGHSYHGISATEVIEHLHGPKAVFEQWVASLRPGGVLGIMTKLVKNQSAFASWHYKNDPTHVCFYSEATFAFLAKRYNLRYEQKEGDVALFYRSSRQPDA